MFCIFWQLPYILVRGQNKTSKHWIHSQLHVYTHSHAHTHTLLGLTPHTGTHTCQVEAHCQCISLWPACSDDLWADPQGLLETLRYTLESRLSSGLAKLSRKLTPVFHSCCLYSDAIKNITESS